jgi:L-lactate dehydrogenase
MDGTGKIAIIGAGHVGSHCALALAWSGVAADIVLIDILPEKARAQALDVSDALILPPRPARVRAGDYAEAADADIVVVAVGEAWKPGQTRLDLFDASLRMLSRLMESLLPLRLRGIVVTITNPADVVADYVRRALGLPRSRCFGTGTLLDTARLVRLLAEGTGLPRSAVSGLVVGEHGDSSVPAFSQVRLDGRSVAAYPALDREALARGTRRAGMEVVEGKGSTEFGIGQVTATLCAALLGGGPAVLPLSAALEGEYGQSGIHAGVPCRVGRGGIEEIVELELDAGERSAFAASCEVIRGYVRRAQAKA